MIVVVSAVLVLSCGQTDTRTHRRGGTPYSTPAAVVSMSNKRTWVSEEIGKLLSVYKSFCNLCGLDMWMVS